MKSCCVNFGQSSRAGVRKSVLTELILHGERKHENKGRRIQEPNAGPSPIP